MGHAIKILLIVSPGATVISTSAVLSQCHVISTELKSADDSTLWVFRINVWDSFIAVIGVATDGLVLGITWAEKNVSVCWFSRSASSSPNSSSLERSLWDSFSSSACTKKIDFKKWSSTVQRADAAQATECKIRISAAQSATCIYKKFIWRSSKKARVVKQRKTELSTSAYRKHKCPDFG